MPILNPGSEDFAGFDVNSDFASNLHSPRIAGAGGKVTKFYRDLVAERSVYQQWRNFSSISRFGIGNVAINHGVISDRLGAMLTLYSEAPRIDIDEVGNVIASKAIEGALLAFDEALEVVGTKVPIVGWVVQLGVFIYDVISSAITGAESDAPEMAAAQAIAYDKDADEEVTRLLLDEVKRDNWTRLFLPQQKPETVTLTSLAYTSRGIRDGYAWEVTGDSWGWGLTPGLSSKFSGFIGPYQTPRKLIGSTRDAGIESITPFGELHPSVMQFGMYAWQMCLKNSANAFRINGERIVSAWHDQFGELLNWAYTATMKTTQGHTFSSSGAEWMRSQVEKSMQWWDPDIDETRVEKQGKHFGSARGQSRVEGFDPDDLPSRYTQSNLWWYSELIDYIINEVWRPRLDGFLETLTCAYVGPNAPALKMNDGLKQKHRDMRARLLEHDAVYRVEVDMVPDDDYRAAVYQKQLIPPPKFTAAPQVGKKLWLDYVPPIDPDDPPPPPPDTNPAPGLTPTPTDTSGGAAIGLLLGGAAAVALAKLATRR